VAKKIRLALCVVAVLGSMFVGAWVWAFGINPFSDRSRPRWRPLLVYCREWTCPGYTETVAALQRHVARNGCHFAEIGQCGLHRFVAIGDPFHQLTEYFDADGSLVAARATVDVIPFQRIFGSPPSCTPVVTKTYCGEPLRDPW
jgi:hypothetical protein